MADRDLADRLAEALDGLLRYAWKQTCQHEETYRGGAIWEICRSCGMKWADDTNPRKPYCDPPEIANASAALSTYRAAKEQK